MPKDTRTRYQGIYARHRLGCALEAGASECSCGPSYWGQVWDKHSGRRHKTRFFVSIAEARNARADLAVKVQAGALPASTTMSVSNAIDAFLSGIEAGSVLNKHGRPYKPSALRDLSGALDGHVRPALGSRKLSDLRRGDVQRLVDSLTPTKSGSRVRTIVNALRSLYAWAQDREIVHHDPAARVRLPAMNATPRDRVAGVEEMERLLGALTPADALPFALAVYATARRGEIRYARVGDVDLAHDVIYLGADEAARKSRAALRAVPLVKPLAQRIRRELLRRGRPSPDERLCPGRKSGRRNSGLLSFEALQVRADARWEGARKDDSSVVSCVGERITAHECRHTCASWLHAAGLAPIVVSQLMGHAAPSRQFGGAPITLERYTHALPEDLERAGSLFEQWLTQQLARERDLAVTRVPGASS